LSALLYAGLGDKTKAIDYLKREYFDHDNIDPSEMRVDVMLTGCEAIRASRHSRRDRINGHD